MALAEMICRLKKSLDGFNDSSETFNKSNKGLSTAIVILSYFMIVFMFIQIGLNLPK